MFQKGQTVFYRLSTYAIAAALFPDAANGSQETIIPDHVKSEERQRRVTHATLHAPDANLFGGTVVQDNGHGRATAKS
jgi:hypothetical protein